MGIMLFFQAGWAELMWNGFYMARKTIVMSFPKEHASSRGAGLLRGSFLMSDDLEHMSLSSSGNVVGRILEVSATLFTYHHDGHLQIQKETCIVYHYTYIIILYINYHKLYYVKLYHTN